ncbi:MAG: acyl carrier protein [Alphaproteobacteria bacterium]|nr:acyl carrier protein [Alphaproteobacteria bacterium]
MTEDEIRAVLLDELARIAPDVDPGDVDPTGDLREEFDIDSMDFLNLVTALHERLGVEIPEADYQELASLDGAVAYLRAR